MEMELTLRINNRIIDLSQIVKYGINSGKQKKVQEQSWTDKLFDLSLKKLLITDKPKNPNKLTGPYLYICFKEGGQINIRQDSETNILKIKELLDKLRTIGLINFQSQY